MRRRRPPQTTTSGDDADVEDGTRQGRNLQPSSRESSTCDENRNAVAAGPYLRLRRVGIKLLLSSIVILLSIDVACRIILRRIDLPTWSMVHHELVGPDRATVAIVSLHRGFKFRVTPLGRWLSDIKRTYALRHGYAYLDERSFPSDEDALERMSDWQGGSSPRRAKYDKLRYLLYLMETYPNLGHLLWIDGDAVFTAEHAVEDRIELFLDVKKRGSRGRPTRVMMSGGSDHEDDFPFCLVWAADGVGPNSGIMILSNIPNTRSLLRSALRIYSPDDPKYDTLADQESLTEAVRRNDTYSSCQLLLGRSDVGEDGEGEARLLQSRVRGPPNLLWRDGDWILHMPNHNVVEMIRSLYSWLPHTSDPEACPPSKPLPPPDLASLDDERRRRYEAVRDAIRHAWDGYANVTIRRRNGWWRKFFTGAGAIPADDASPLSNSAHSWLYHAATLHDSIDTLYLSNLTDEYEEAVEVAIGGLSPSYSVRTSYLPTKTFEYSLRVVGGLAGAYVVSGDDRLLAAAVGAADALLEGPFRSSPTVLPRKYDVLAPPVRNGGGCGGWGGGSLSSYLSSSFRRIYASLYRFGRDAFTEEHRTNSLAGVGSFGLEFAFLSAITGDETYRLASEGIFRHLVKRSSLVQGGGNAAAPASAAVAPRGVIPTGWNVMSGDPIGTWGATLASGADSFYEYLVKTPLLHDCTDDDDDRGRLRQRAGGVDGKCNYVDEQMWSLYRSMVRGLLRPHLTSTGSNEGVVFPVEDGRYFHHLLCFVPAMLALGAGDDHKGGGGGGGGDGDEDGDMKLAKDLLRGCGEAYSSTPTGLAPERAAIHGGRLVPVHAAAAAGGGDGAYRLRPEYVESLFVLYRLTKDRTYQDLGWEVFRRIEEHCRVDNGYVGLVNVYDATGGGEGGRIDDMPSYFIAETLKYLLLLFGPDEYVSLDDYVFTTEAHPMRKTHRHRSHKCLPMRDRAVWTGPTLWPLLAALLPILFVAHKINLPATATRFLPQPCRKKKGKNAS